MSVKVDLEFHGVVSNAKKGQLRIKYMPVESLPELKTILKNAKVGIKKDGLFNKTYFNDFDDKYIFFNYKYVLWVERDGLMTMTYDVDDDENEIQQFMNKIEKSAGCKLFYGTKQGAINRIEELNTPPEYMYQTKFTDKDIITKILKGNNINPKVTSNGFEFNISGFGINLYKTKEENYEIKAIGNGNTGVIESMLGKLTTEYDKIVQTNICNNIKQRVAKSPTMRLEQEQILEDDSVLLTIRI